jgi:hypothetical protein
MGQHIGATPTATTNQAANHVKSLNHVSAGPLKFARKPERNSTDFPRYGKAVYFLNPSGSRNLEFAPDLAIPPGQ